MGEANGIDSSGGGGGGRDEKCNMGVRFPKMKMYTMGHRLIGNIKNKN